MDNTTNEKKTIRIKTPFVSKEEFMGCLKDFSYLEEELSYQLERKLKNVRYLHEERKVRSSKYFNATFMEAEAEDREDGTKYKIVLVACINMDENTYKILPRRSDKIDLDYHVLIKSKELLVLFGEDLTGEEVKEMKVKKKERVFSKPIIFEDENKDMYSICSVNEEVTDEFSWKREEDSKK